MNVINSYGSDSDKLRNKSERCELLEEQLKHYQLLEQSKSQEIE